MTDSDQRFDISMEIRFQRANRRRLLGEDLTRNAINFPDRIALHDIETGWNITHQKFESRVNWVARKLLEKGLKTGGRICMLGRNYVDSLTLYYAVSRMGAIIVPLNYSANAEELRYIIEDCTPSMMAVSTEFIDRVDKSLTRSMDIFTYGPGENDGDLAGWIESGHAEAPDLDIDDRKPVFILYTGGTTGRPKGVALSQAGYIAMADNTAHALSPQGIGRSDSWLILGPLYHGAALAYSVTGLHFAQTVHLLREFNAEKAIAAITRGFGTVTWFIPTVSRKTINYIGQTAIPLTDLEGLRLIISAGAPLSLQLRQELRQTFRRCQVIDIVGQTELTSTLIALSEPGDIVSTPTAVGLPMPGISVALMDDENRLLSAGEVGELCYQSESLMLGYWNKPEITREAMAGGWFHSGDLARRDASGVISIVGRKKELIKSGGENIIPNEIEDVLRQAPGVVDVCVLGLQDRTWGERVHAVIAIGNVDADLEVIRSSAEAHCRARLSRYKLPKTWSIIDMLPANAIGKCDKAKLRVLVGDGTKSLDLRGAATAGS